MQIKNVGHARRAAGRLFSKEGRLHLVLEVDATTGVAKVSCRVDDTTQVIEMPISDVIKRLGSSDPLKLDGLSSERTEVRVIEKDNCWFYRAREGEYGPYADKEAAKRALKRHILLAQEDGRTGRPAQAMSG